MGFFNKMFGGETSRNSEVAENKQEEYPAFRGAQNIEPVKPKTEAERQAEISAARDAVKNAYGRQNGRDGQSAQGGQNQQGVRGEQSDSADELMDFEKTEQKVTEFFDAVQGLTEGMNLYYGMRAGWPTGNNWHEFMQKFGGEDLNPQKGGEICIKMSFATSLIDAEAKRRKIDSDNMDRAGKEKVFSNFQYYLYKVYAPPEMGSSAWLTNKSKFEVSNPATGFDGAYEKFFGSEADLERKALAEKTINLYDELSPFLDAKTRHRMITEFGNKNRGRKIKGFKLRGDADDATRRFAVDNAEGVNDVSSAEMGAGENRPVNLYDLRDRMDDEIMEKEDAMRNLVGDDAYTQERRDRLQGKIREVEDEKVVMNWLMGQNQGQETVGGASFAEQIVKYISEQNRIIEATTEKRDRSEKGSEEFRSYAKSRNDAIRRRKAAERILNRVKEA